jgi:pimeloyl-ACP methyl ester carboxylesterase
MTLPYLIYADGTILGQTYAQMFPERVSRLVIDGVVSLDTWYNKFSDYKELLDTDRAYAGFIEECFNAKENCALNSIKKTSFGTASDMRRYIDNFIQKLEEEPIPVYLSNTRYGAVTRENVVTNGILPALYQPVPAWSKLAKNLANLVKGNATQAFIDYSTLWYASFITDDSTKFVVMNDNRKTGSEAPIHGIKAIVNYTLSLERPSMLMSRYLGSAAFDRAGWSIPTTHKFLPHYYPEYPRVKTAKPILILSNTYDPVCPLKSAQKAFSSFEGAGFVEQKSYGHCTPSMPSLCTAKHVRRYFHDGLLPNGNTT